MGRTISVGQLRATEPAAPGPARRAVPGPPDSGSGHAGQAARTASAPAWLPRRRRRRRLEPLRRPPHVAGPWSTRRWPLPHASGPPQNAVPSGSLFCAGVGIAGMQPAVGGHGVPEQGHWALVHLRHVGFDHSAPRCLDAAAARSPLSQALVAGPTRLPVWLDGLLPRALVRALPSGTAPWSGAAARGLPPRHELRSAAAGHGAGPPTEFPGAGGQHRTPDAHRGADPGGAPATRHFDRGADQDG